MVGATVVGVGAAGTLVVGLTGATGHIGGRLLDALLADPGVGQVRSVARRPLPPRGAKLAHVQAELASPQARQALRGADIVYHLGAQVWQGRGSPGLASMYAANVEGTANVLEAGDQPVVLASSVAVYGAWPDNPLPLEEHHRPRPNPECPYAQHKLVAEKLCAHSGRPGVVVRLSAVLGPHADARVAKALGGLRWAVPAVRGVSQAVQWTDEQDAVTALLAAGRALLDRRPEVCGQVFNVASADWLGAEDVAAISGGRVLALPRSLLLDLAKLGPALGITPFGADRAALVNGPLAVSVAKAAAVLGWAPAHTSAQVVRAALQRGWRGAPLNRVP